MEGMEGVSVTEIARFIVGRDSELVGIAGSQWRTDSVVRERVDYPPGQVMITLIVH